MSLVSDQTQKNLERFRRHRYRNKRLKDYYAQYSTDNLYVEIDPHVRSVLAAQGLSWEESPRSIYRVEKLFQALTAYAPGNCRTLDPSENLTSGIALARKCFAKPEMAQHLHVLPFTPHTITLITSNPSGSPGTTAYGVSKAQAQTRALERGLQTLEGVKQPEPCLAFKRTQKNDKTRLVWGYPYSMTCIEGLIAWPLNERFKSGTTPMAYAMPSGVLGTRINVATYHNRYAYSLDMSQYDATLSPTLIRAAFSILKTWYDLSEIEPVSGKTVGEIFSAVEDYFIHTPIVMPDGYIYYGKQHGVPSGSFFTQMIDSICNVIICGTISSRFSLHVSRREVFVLGDDILFFTNRLVSLDKIAQYAKRHLGVKMHGSEKSFIYKYDEPIHFLGRNWKNAIPDLPIEEIVQKMVYPEQRRKYDDDQAKAKRQLHLMLLSYASQYRSAWSIAFSCIDPSNLWYHRGCANVDVHTYLEGSRKVELTPQHLSGLMRFLMREGRFNGDADIPCTAIQFWL